MASTTAKIEDAVNGRCTFATKLILRIKQAIPNADHERRCSDWSELYLTHANGPALQTTPPFISSQAKCKSHLRPDLGAIM